jgi:hypothetical protein
LSSLSAKVLTATRLEGLSVLGFEKRKKDWAVKAGESGKPFRLKAE